MDRTIIFLVGVLIGVLLGVWVEMIRSAMDYEEAYLRGLREASESADRLIRMIGKGLH